ncbi:MAG: hypothetical protein ABEL51_03265 [Salinibacter sp.]
MAYCPHCNRRYDETNETQPCCGTCGHPISCGCGGGHLHASSSSSVPSSLRHEFKEDFVVDEEEPEEADGSGAATDSDSTPNTNEADSIDDGANETDDDYMAPLALRPKTY